VFEQVKCGEVVAFEEIYRRYKQRIFAYCWRIVQDRWLAEDVFQQTFMSVFEHRDQYTGGNFAAWIYTIARNWAFKARARQQRIRGHEIQEPEEGIDAIAPDASPLYWNTSPDCRSSIAKRWSFAIWMSYRTKT